jgi:mannose-6-phosphate isomerase-like protein (cupin superfamily)
MTANAAAAVSASSTSLPSIATDAITAIAPTDRETRPCKFGFLREVCVDDGTSFVCFATTEAGSASPWHDHGESTTYALLLKGEAAIEFAGGKRMELRADGTVYVVPPHLQHREINTGTTKNQLLVMRVMR